MITSYGYGTLCLKEGPKQLGPIFSTLFIYFIQFFHLLNTPFRIPITYAHEFFIFATPFRDRHRNPILRLHSRLHSRLTFVTQVHDSTHDSHSRLTFATPLATHIRDSRSRLTFMTPDRTPSCNSLFFCDFPLCDSTTDRWTVLTP